MPQLFTRKNNKSQASLDKIPDPRDHNTSQVHNVHNHSPPGQQGQPQGRDHENIYQPTQQVYGQQVYHTHPNTAQQQQQQQQQQYTGHPHPRDPQQYQGFEESRAPPPINAYQEQQQQQQQLQAQRPTIALVNPNLQQESITEDDGLQPGTTQFGSSHRIRTSQPKEEKKARNSGLRGLFSSKDKKEGRDSPVDNRLSRTGSILKKSSQQYSPQSRQQSVSNPAQSPTQPSHSESISAYLESSQEELSRHEDQRQYEQYYRDPRPSGQYDPTHSPQQQHYPQFPPPQSPQQDLRRPSIQYEEDAPNFPPPSQQYQQHPQQQIYLQQNTSQSRIDQESEDRKEFAQYQNQLPVRDRPAGLFEIDHSLRPPSQSSLGPPSPLGNPPQLVSRSSTTNPPRFSVQSVQAYQAAQEAANQQAQDQSSGLQSQGQVNHPTQQLQAPQQAATAQGTGNPKLLQVQVATGQDEMPTRDRQQRESRQEEEARYAAAQQDPRVRMSTADGGRNTPPPGRPSGREDLASLDMPQLIQKYEELQGKYSKVKRYYFDREAQVTQLQNTVANQRLSMSKTSLDDAQYATRFERLNGAIQNLAFNIRKDWCRIPNWLAPACNRDACTTGTKEMTAVGRACISRWLYEHIFQEIFHPGIDPNLSAQLKQMERTLRRTPSILTDEQRDDLLTKVMTWRLTTCESLQDVLNSRQNEAYTDNLSRILADQLCEYLCTLLNDPAPPNLEGYLLPIVAQTLSIAANLPLESRDIGIEYYYPGSPFNEVFMKLETGMTALVQPGSAPTREDYDDMDDDEPQSVASDRDRDRDDIGSNVNPNIGTHTVKDAEEQIREAYKQATAGGPNNSTQPSTSNKTKKSGGIFGGGFGGAFVGANKKPTSQQRMPAGGPDPSKGKDSPELQKGSADSEDHAWNFDALTRGQKEGKIRFAVFLAVEVRGKSAKSEGQGASSAGSGSGSVEKADGKSGSQVQNQAGSAGPGVSAGERGGSGGTSGAAGTGGVNVLVKAPVFGF